jgi:S-adenosylmethionine:tRNA ribosyltransferase-isomerase
VKVSEFDFPLPQRLIAQHPLPERDQSRMMVVRRKSATWEHRAFRHLPEILTPEHFLVLNNTRVFPARLRAHRPGKEEQIEVLLAREETPGIWSALVKPARKAAPGQELQIGSLKASVREVRPDGIRCLRLDNPQDLPSVLETQGEPPLPHYIRRPIGADLSEDKRRYQTVYAKHSGSIAAPTAGLHFTPEILKRLEHGGIQRCEILLHVGYGTFQPVRVENVDDHRMAPEYFELSDDAARRIREQKSAGRLLTAVGTTTTRVLEFWARQAEYPHAGLSGFCDLFIRPGFEFRLLDGLLTNFHLPRSTLLMLVCAFVGRDFMLECYHEAVREEYRFFSYGDCMLIL